MFSGGYTSSKLSTNLKLSVHRLKLMGKKKTEQAQKARREIADYLANGKDDRARVRVEHIIREDYLVEAMELTELYCDLLLARFGLIKTMKAVDEGLQESIASVIWVAPRMSTDVAELKTVAEQFKGKYGKEFFEICVSDREGWVNERLKHKMSAKAPAKVLVERYLIEIARSHNVPYEPDPSVLNGEDVENLLIDIDDLKPPSGPPGGSGGGGGGMPAGAIPTPPVPQPHPQPHPQAAYPPPGMPNPGMAYPPPLNRGAPPPLPAKAPVGVVPNGMMQPPMGAAGGYQQTPSAPPPAMPAPPYELHDSHPTPYPPAANAPTQPPVAAPRSNNPSIPSDSIPNLPSVPVNSFPPLDNSVGGKSAGGEDVDFDDLSRRFEELKKKK